MVNILHSMKDPLLRYADIISRVSKMAVQVVDSNYLRIIYNGMWRKPVDVEIGQRGHIVYSAISSGKTQLMLDPRSHAACKNCPERDRCYDIGEVWAPIMAGSECLGAIGFICETVSQQKMLKKDHETLIPFLEQIAKLISLDAMQRMEINRVNEVTDLLERIVDTIDSGVIVIDEHDTVIRFNKSALHILQDYISEAGEFPINIQKTGNVIDSKYEYILLADNWSHSVVGTLYAIGTSPYHQVLIFNDASSHKQSILQGSVIKQVVGTSPEIQKVRNIIRTSSNSHSSVLINADSGFARELYARAIHNAGSRWNKPFVTIDCADLPEQTPDKYLLGFTSVSGTPGAKSKPGRIDAAEGGTLFLDNVNALPLSIQKRLIPLLERRELARVGSKRTRKTDIRVIAATTEDLVAQCDNGSFSRDFYYLLNVIPLRIPSISERKEDIRPLAVSFIQYFSIELNKPVEDITDEFWESVQQYDWPGNIRELRSAMEYAINMMDYPQIVTSNLLPGYIVPAKASPMLDTPVLNLKQLEDSAIHKALEIQKEKNLTNKDTAQLLGIGLATFYRKIKELS